MSLVAPPGRRPTRMEAQGQRRVSRYQTVTVVPRFKRTDRQDHPCRRTSGRSAGTTLRATGGDEAGGGPVGVRVAGGTVATAVTAAIAAAAAVGFAVTTVDHSTATGHASRPAAGSTASPPAPSV